MSSFQKDLDVSADSAQDRGDGAMEPSAVLQLKTGGEGDLVKCSPVCPQFLTRSAFSPRWHLDQRPGRGTFIRPSPSGVRRPPSSISAEVGQCEHRGAGKADPPAVVQVISLFNTQELYFRNCPILRTFYVFQLIAF